MRGYLLCAVAVIAGCNLYFGGGHADDQCYETPPSNILVRDVFDGQCETQPGGCDACGVCPPVLEAPDFECHGPCDNLDESHCTASAQCHAAYTFTPPGADGTGGSPGPVFSACWNIAPQTPEQGGDCTMLDPITCAMHDDCATELTPATGGASCIPTGSCLRTSCGSNAFCVQTCNCPAGSGACDCEATCMSQQTCADIACLPNQTCVEVCSSDGTCSPQCQ